MIAGAWILGFFLVQEAKPPQEPEAKAKEREQPRDTDRSREPTDASEMTRAAARLIEASNYRFRVTGGTLTMEDGTTHVLSGTGGGEAPEPDEGEEDDGDE